MPLKMVIPTVERRGSGLFDRIAQIGPARFVIWTIAVSTVVRLLLAACTGYGYGESYYLASARHLALSYFDQPPVALWIAWATSKLVGVGTPVLTRLPFIAMFAITSWLMFRLGERLFGAWAGAWAAFLLNLSLVFAVSIGSWVQPDGPLFLFLLAAALPIVELCFGRPQHPMRLWLGAGAAFGLAILSKYHAALVLCGLLIFVATTPGYRAWFFRRGLVGAAIVAAAAFAPVLIWNAQNGWVSFLFQGDRIIESEGIRVDWLLRSIAGQAAEIGFGIWPFLIAVFVGALRAGPKNPKTWFLACLAIVPIGVFTIAALWAPLGWHFHWQAPGYVFLFPLLGNAVATRVEGSRIIRGCLVAATLLFLGFLGGAGAQALTGWVYHVLPKELQAKPYVDTNPLREMLSWRELRGALIAQKLIPHDRLFVATTRWFLAGKADVQIGDDLPVVCLCNDPRNIAFVWDHRKFLGWDALIILPSDFLPREGNVDVLADFRPYFREISPATKVDIDLGGSVALTIYVYYARDYYRPYPLNPTCLAGTAGC